MGHNFLGICPTFKNVSLALGIVRAALLSDLSAISAQNLELWWADPGPGRG